MSQRRIDAEAYIIKLMNDIDKTGANADYYAAKFDKMSTTEFDKYMKALRDGGTQLYSIMPNSTAKITTNSAIALAKKRKVTLFSRIWYNDLQTGRRFLSKYPVLVLPLPVRRVSQYLFHKLSLPDSDKKVNPITGQVIAGDKGAALSNVETQMLASKGLKTSIVELLKLRGGDVRGYYSMKQLIETTGSASFNDIDLTNKPRSVVTTGRYLHGMMIETDM